MLKKLLMSAAFIGCLTTTAHAMDDAERARQMELFKVQNAGGAQITTTTTTAPTPMPAMPTPAPAQVLSARSVPAQETTTTQTTVTTTTAPMATAAPAPIARQMTPLNDDGTPMNVKPMADTLGATNATASDHEREMQAWKEWQASNARAQAPATQTTTVTSTTSTTAEPTGNLVAPYMAPATPMAAPMAGADGTVTTTMDEKTTATNYTVSSRKVGLVGNRPYPAQTAEIQGGVTKEVSINGVAQAPEIVVPDTVAATANEPAKGDYFSNRRAARYYKDTGVHVHDMGKLNGNNQ